MQLLQTVGTTYQAMSFKKLKLKQNSVLLRWLMFCINFLQEGFEIFWREEVFLIPK